MLSRIFPRVADNSYRGHWLGIALFVLVLALRTTQGINSIVITRMVATGADAIPLDTFSAAAANTVLALFALLGVTSLLVSSIGIVALIRYRALIPFLFLVFLIGQISARLVLSIDPITRSTDPSVTYAGQPIGFWFNLAMIGVTAIGFALSISGPSNTPVLAKEPH